MQDFEGSEQKGRPHAEAEGKTSRSYSQTTVSKPFIPSFRRHQPLDISPKSGRNQLSQVPGKQPKDPKQLFFLGSFKTSFWSLLLRPKQSRGRIVLRIPFRESSSCTGQGWEKCWFHLQQLSGP